MHGGHLARVGAAGGAGGVGTAALLWLLRALVETPPPPPGPAVFAGSEVPLRAEAVLGENLEYLPAILAFILGYILGVISGPAIDALYLLRVCWRRLVVAAERRLTVQRPRGAPPALHG